MVFPHRHVMHRAVTRHDSLLGYRFVSSAAVRVPHERGCYWVRTNAQGFRADEDFTPDRRDDRPRVLVFGDSFTAGDGVDNDERFTEHLAAMHGLAVFNMALSGAGADQLVLALEEALPVLRPDLVVLAPSVHTIQRVLAPHRDTLDRLGRVVRIPRPHFVLEDDHLVLRGVPAAEMSELVAAPPSSPPLDAPWRVACSDAVDFALGEGGRDALADLRWMARGAVRRVLQRWASAEFDPHYVDPNTDGWRLLARIVARFHEVARGVPVVIAPLPTPPYVADRLEPRFSARFASLDDPARGLHVVDVTARLRGAPLATRRGYTYARDQHPSAAGHRAIAEALSQALVERGLVSSAQPRTVGRAATEARASAGTSNARDVTLQLGFTRTNAFARSVRDDVTSALVWESDVALAYTCPGFLPYAALAQVLEDAALQGGQLARIELIAPDRFEDALERASESPDAPADLFALVRWIGAAERDVRRLLRFTGPVVHSVAESLAIPPSRVDSQAESAADPETQWLRTEWARISARRGSIESRRRAFLQLCARWERATRRARYAFTP